MKNARLQTTALPRRSETPAFTGALHDFLVPNPRPDLSCDDELCAVPPRRTPRREIEPDSIFWNPELHAGDAA